MILLFLTKAQHRLVFDQGSLFPRKDLAHPSNPTKFTFLLLGCLFSTVFLCNQAMCESLENAVKRALTGNPNIAASKLLVLQSEEGISQAKAAWRPNVQLRLKGGTKRSSTDSSASSNLKSSYLPLSATVSLSQRILDFGETSAAIEKSKIEKQISEEQLQKIRDSIIRDAILAYLEVWRDKRLLIVAEKEQHNLEQQLQATKKRFSLREVTQTDLSQTEARLKDSIAGRIQADVQLETALAIYREVIGPIERTERLFWSLESLDPYPFFGTLEEAKVIAYAENSDMKDLRFQLASAKYSILQNRSDLLPQVSLEASISGARNPSPTIDTTNNLSLEGVVTVPLYDSGVSRSSLLGL